MKKNAVDGPEYETSEAAWLRWKRNPQYLIGLLLRIGKSNEADAVAARIGPCSMTRGSLASSYLSDCLQSI